MNTETPLAALQFDDQLKNLLTLDNDILTDFGRTLPSAASKTETAKPRLTQPRNDPEMFKFADFNVARANDGEQFGTVAEFNQAIEMSRFKDEFLAIVSHELRTPLNAILGWCQLLQKGKISGADCENALAVIERNALAQVQLIENLLDASRLVSGNLRLEPTSVTIVPILEAALETIRPAAEAKQIELVAVLDPAVAQVVCDPRRLHQIVWNLLINAVKFTKANGRIELQMRQENHSLTIVVSDNGQGIAPGFLPFVFDRFQQADSSSTREHNGLGLGLAIVRHLTELHGGTVCAESDGIGAGASFTVTLPTATPQARTDND